MLHYTTLGTGPHNVITSKATWKLKHANSVLESFEYFCQISSKLIHKISSYTVSKLGRFLRHSVDGLEWCGMSAVDKILNANVNIQFNMLNQCENVIKSFEKISCKQVFVKYKNICKLKCYLKGWKPLLNCKFLPAVFKWPFVITLSSCLLDYPVVLRFRYSGTASLILTGICVHVYRNMDSLISLSLIYSRWVWTMSVVVVGLVHSCTLDTRAVDNPVRLHWTESS